MLKDQDSYYTLVLKNLRVLNRRKICVIISILAFSLGAIIQANKLPNVYQASCTVIFPEAPQITGLSQVLSAFSRANVPTPGLAPSGGGASQNLVNILKSRSVAEYVARHFNMAKGTSIEKAALAIRGGAHFSPDVGMITVKYESTDPKQAAEIANYYPVALRNYLDKDFKGYRDNLKQRADKIEGLLSDYDKMIAEGSRRWPAKWAADGFKDSLRQQYDLARSEENVYSNFQVLDSALVPESPSGPHRRKIAYTGALTGLAIGILLAFLWEASDNRIHEAEVIEDKLRIPVLGTLTLNEGWKDISPKVINISEQEKIIRKNIEGFFADNHTRPRKIIFSSIEENPEKPILIGKIGQALFEGGKKVLVINYSTNTSLPLTSNPASPTFDIKNVSEKDQFLNPGEFSGYDYVLVNAPSGIMSSSLYDLVEWADVTFPVVKIGNTSIKELALHKANLDEITRQVKAIVIIPPAVSPLSEVKKILSHKIDGSFPHALKQKFGVYKIRNILAKLPKAVLKQK